MKKHFVAAIGLVAVLHSAANAMPLAARFERFRQQVGAINDGDATKLDNAVRIGQAFAAFRQDTVANATSSADELDLLFRGAEIAASHTDESTYVDQMLALERTLEANSAWSERRIRSVYRQLVNAHLFAAAAQWQLAHASILTAALPAMEEGVDAGSAPSVYTVSRQGRSLSRQPFDLGSGPRVIVVGHPNCHFSANAETAMHEDADLARRLQGRIQWIAPQDAILDIDALQAWNQDHPQSAFAIAYRWRDWPLIGQWDTPNFYFFNHGRLVAQVTGWPKVGNKEKINAALTQIGL